MADFTQLTKWIPTAASVVIVGSWTTPALAFFPPITDPGDPGSVSTVPNPVPTVPVSPTINVPPVSPPPFIPPAPPTVDPGVPVSPTSIPPVPPTCGCSPIVTPTEVPEPATLVAGAIGLATVGAASLKKRRGAKSA